jgi:hypothetical protein
MVPPLVIAAAVAVFIAGSMLLSGYYLSLEHKWANLARDQIEFDKANDAEQDLRDAEMIEQIKQSCIDDELSAFDCNARLMEYYEFIARCDAKDATESGPSLLENAAKYFGTENMKYLIIAAFLAFILTRG